ncbi:MAG: response regulator transcription factor [Clostridia bacterium]|nr:response regulator transcription factor [Clostridia bacterium]
MARIDALARRVDILKSVKKKNTLTKDPFHLDYKGRRFFKNNQEIELTQLEFEIIKMFLESPDKAWHRDEILDKVWGQDYFGNWKTVDVNIRRLRQKIEDNPSEPQFIITVWGYGYRWGNGGHN